MAESFARGGQNLTTTNATTVYTAPTASGAKTVLLACTVANVSGSGVVYTVAITDNADVVQSRIIAEATMPPNTSLEVVQNKLILNAGEKIRVTAGTANAIDVTIAALEITP